MSALVRLDEKVFCNCVVGHGGSVAVMIFHFIKSGVKDRIVIRLTDRSARVVFQAFGNASELWPLTIAVSDMPRNFPISISPIPASRLNHTQS